MASILNLNFKVGLYPKYSSLTLNPRCHHLLSPCQGVDGQSQQKQKAGKARSRGAEPAGGKGWQELCLVETSFQACLSLGQVMTGLLLNSRGLSFLIYNRGRVAIKEMRVELTCLLSRELSTSRENRKRRYQA